MLIPVPKGARCTASASVMKPGRCAACGCDYVYLVQCSAEGEGSTFLYGLSDAATDEARDIAQQKAEAALQQQIASRTRDVPCPACGVIPPGAVARGRALAFLLCSAPAVVLAGLLLAGKVSEDMAPIAWGIAGALVLLGFCLALLRRSRVAVPAEPRDVTSLASALSRGRAIRVSVFDAIMASPKHPRAEAPRDVPANQQTAS